MQVVVFFSAGVQSIKRRTWLRGLSKYPIEGDGICNEQSQRLKIM